MKTQKIVQSPIVKRIHDLKFEYYANVLWGNPRKAKESHKRLAEVVVDHFEDSMKIESPIKGSFSIFSKAGFNYFKYLIYDFFTKDSSAEKKWKQMLKDYKAKKENLK